MGSEFNEMFVDKFNDKLIDFSKSKISLISILMKQILDLVILSLLSWKKVEKLAEMKANEPKELTEDIRKEYHKADCARIFNEFKMKKR